MTVIKIESLGRTYTSKTGVVRKKTKEIKALPLTHGLLAIRGVIDGASYLEVAPLMTLELFIGLMYATIARLIFRKRIMDKRRTGQLELV